MDVCDDVFPFLVASRDVCATRRRVLLAPLLAAVPFVMAETAAQAGKIDPSQTAITLPDAVQWVPWSGLPPHSGEMATLYFTPMPAEDMQLLRQRCAPFAADGHLELFKSTKRYDGAVGRERHGYPPSAELPL